MKKNSEIFDRKIILWSFCFIIATLFVLVLSPQTSILYNYKMGMLDPMVFYNIGKYWFKDGDIPYVDLWEMKGPIILFINGLGYCFTHSMRGISLIQIPCFAIAIYYSYKIFKRRYTSITSYILSASACLCVALTYDGGDNCEEFLFPVLMVSYYGFIKWADSYTKETPQHDWRFAFVYGVVLGFSLLVRLTNALGCMGGVAFVLVVLLWHKQWKNIWQNAISFIGGFAVITLPFVVYFWQKDALYEMWYGTFLYNLDYAKDAANSFSPLRALSVYVYGTFLLLIGCVQICLRKSYIRGGLWISSCILLMAWLVNSFGFAHYGNLCYPCLCVAIAECKGLIKSEKKEIIIAIFVLVFAFFVFSIRLKRTIVYTHQYNNVEAELLLKAVPKEEYNSLSLYNCNYELYYYYDIKPNVKYFGLQDLLASRSESMRKRVYEEFDKVNPKWIMFKKTSKDVVIKQIVDNDYYAYKQEGAYVLYRHR